MTISTAACGGSDDQVCGPPVGTDSQGVMLTIDGMAVTYGGFTSGANNDCPVAGSATSLSVEGRQVLPAPSQPFALTFCLPSPEKLKNGSVPLSDETSVLVVDVSAEQGGCTFARDSSQPATGSMTFSGYCAAGVDPAGYALAFEATVAGLKTCGANPAVPVTMRLTGSASVAPL